MRSIRLPAPASARLRSIAIVTIAVAWIAAFGVPAAAPAAPAKPPSSVGAAPTTAPTDPSLAPHESAEGFVLSPSKNAGGPASKCPGASPVRAYDVAAINVDITVNRYLDHDPQGRMYVLESDLARVRAEETANAAARAGHGDPAVTPGLQGDAIQPLTLRVTQGECLRIRFRNALNGTEPASIQLDGAGLRVAGAPLASRAVAGGNPKAIIKPGAQLVYEWYVRPTEPEGTHQFHSHGNDRIQADHGLFGAVIVEPRGSTWTDPSTGKPEHSGWSAVVQPPGAQAFREFALYYHEMGNENYQLLDRNGNFVPLVDPITHAYRPDARAINYRSEPFMNRLLLEQQKTGRVDESLEYSSYAFGDPSTPIMRSYLGDPVKQRLVHGGGETFHVHHVHGGGTRWIRQPATAASAVTPGLNKHPQLVSTPSDRTDSQAIGPSETFDIENECGAGGCQQSAGDYMFHCHVAHHYFAGMWGIWRVYNTLQDGKTSTDALPPLPPLPALASAVAPAVTSQALAGRTVSWFGQSHQISDVGSWIAGQLPPAGVPHSYDASVWDWKVAGGVAVGEPETTETWPGYTSPAPGQRLAILWDPLTGKPAYPLLRPHFAARPPFAPHHGPAPFLDPTASSSLNAPAAGASGPGSICPAGSTVKPVAINAITTSIPLNAKQDLVDPNGELFVLRHQEQAVLNDPKLRIPLVMRANAGQDCLDVVLRSELTDNSDDPFSKVGAHIHFVQFDIQGSDGVDTGFSYEQTVRPYKTSAVSLVAPAAAGSSTLLLSDTSHLQPGIDIGIGLDQDATFETRRVVTVGPDVVGLDSPLTFGHGAGEAVGTEYVRYRWYVDSQFGTAFFHDHVNVIHSSQHGLFGALISEPPGSTYVDPHTGAPVTSGLLADIHTTSPLSPDVNGSFREVAMLIQDDNPITHVGRSSGSSLDLRAEPLDGRGGDPSMLFSSTVHGDPETPLVDAYLGDPIAVRTLAGGGNDVHSFHVDGHWFRIEPQTTFSPPTNTLNVGISERYDVFIPSAGGPQAMPGDYLYYNGRSFKLHEGSWGILRVLPSPTAGLQLLPGHTRPPPPATHVCPAGAPQRRFDVHAVSVALPMLDGSKGKAYVLVADLSLIGHAVPSPLVLHADVGDCIVVDLTNDTTDGPVSFHADMLAFDPQTSGGVNAGLNKPQTVAPGARGEYTFFASPQVGPTTALVRDWGNVLVNPGLGLYGAIVVAPAGSTFTDPVSGRDASASSNWQVVVHPAKDPAYRDFTLMFQDQDAGIGTHRMPYTVNVDGTVGVNYQTAPLSDRLSANPDATQLFAASGGMPATPLLQAYAGDPVHVNVLAPFSEQAQVFSIEGHRWPVDPGLKGTTLVSSTQLGGLNALSLWLDGGAGGVDHLPGDYVYGDRRQPYQEAGLWGLFRVRPRCAGSSTGLPRLGGCGSSGGRVLVASGVAVAVIVLGGILAWALLRRRTPLEEVQAG